jgi:endoglucanase
VLQSWDVIVGRYKRHWNVFALDLKNENHGPCSWGSGESFTCWKAASERIMKHIAATHPDFKGLFFVGGIWGGGGHWCVRACVRVF